MTKPVGILISALMLCAWISPAQGDAAAGATKAASVANPPLALPAQNPPPAAGASTAGDRVPKAPALQSPASPAVAAVPAASAASGPAPIDPKKRFQRPTPLKRLIFSAREGFSLRMVSSQEVTAEIRNGAGRTLARGAYTLEAGDWTLRPRNLAPGLYTVLLRTGAQLRAMRMKIEDSERGDGLPEWILEKAPESSGLGDASAQQGASVFPAPD